MSRSRVLLILALLLALSGVVFAQLGATAGAATPSAPTGVVPAGPLDPSPTPTPTPTPTSTAGTPDTITIEPATAAVVDGQLLLSVTADSTTPIQTLTAELSNSTTEIQTSELAMTQTGTGPAGQSTWTTEISASGLPLDVYTVTVDATDEGGTTVSDVPAGTLALPFPAAISASLSANTVTYGGKVTVSGTVTYEPGNTAMALQGQTVQIYAEAGAASPVATAVTGANGQFTAALPTESTSTQWELETSGPFLDTATATLPMKVNLPTVITSFRASLNPFWQATFHGCLGLGAKVPGYIPSLSGLTIQYAAGSKGPWHTLGTVPAQLSSLCGNGGMTFSATLSARLNYAYYRAVYAGGTGLADTGYLSSASGAVLAWKYEDRITSFSVSPHSVSKGGKLTVKGVLQYYSGKWRDYANQQVLIILQPKGSKSWYWIAAQNTNSKGQFSVTFTDPVSATWSAEYLGNSAHLATVAATIYIPLT